MRNLLPVSMEPGLRRIPRDEKYEESPRKHTSFYLHCIELHCIAMHRADCKLHTSHRGFGNTPNILARVIYQCNWLRWKSTFYFPKSCTLVVFPLFLLQHLVDKYYNSKLMITEYCDIFNSKLRDDYAHKNGSIFGKLPKGGIQKISLQILVL